MTLFFQAQNIEKQAKKVKARKTYFDETTVT